MNTIDPKPKHATYSRNAHKQTVERVPVKIYGDDEKVTWNHPDTGQLIEASVDSLQRAATVKIGQSSYFYRVVRNPRGLWMVSGRTHSVQCGDIVQAIIHVASAEGVF